MPHPRLQSVIDWLKGVLTQPRHELDRWERAARFAHDLGQYGARQLRRDRAPQMAGALAFRTLFGLLPVLVMAAVIVRVLQGPQAFIASLRGIIEAGALYDVGPEDGSLGDMLEGFVQQAAVYNINAIGWIGLCVLIYSAISLMVTIENSFNGICRAPQGRTWVRRVPMYWFILTLGPVALGATVYLNGRVERWIENVEAWQWLIKTAAGTWAFLIIWLVMVAVYGLVPNTAMRLRPVLVGAFTAAVLIAIGQNALAVYLQNAFSITLFGGSLGLIPLFMFWVYVMWLVVLFGLEVTATLQMLAGRRLEEIETRHEPTGLVDSTSIVVVMEFIAERFRGSLAATPRELSEGTGIPERTVRLMVERLVEAGLIHRLDRADGAVSLARPPDQIAAAELVDVGFSLVDEGGVAPKSPILRRFREAQRAMAGSATLTELLPPAPVPTGADQVSAAR